MAPSLVSAASERGSIVFGWLARLTLVLGVLGLVAFETLSIAVAKVQLQDTGNTAAHAALDSYTASEHNTTMAYEAAASYADQHDTKIVKKTFVITPDSVTFEVKRTAPTLVLYRWDKTAKWAQIETTIYAEPFESNGSSS